VSTRLLCALAILSWLATPVHSQEGHWGPPNDPAVKAIIAMEKMWASSNCSAQPGLKDVIADDFQGTAPDGKRYGKVQAIETDTMAPSQDCRLGEVRVKFFGESLAIAYGDESSVGKDRAGKARKLCLVWTDTWLRRNSRWQIIAAQDGYLRCK
jgi:hypothetical protein